LVDVGINWCIAVKGNLKVLSCVTVTLDGVWVGFIDQL
jgi:hypothetical protein